jgi:hypothetical protein
VAEHQERPHAEDGDRVLEAGDDLGRRDVAGDTCHKEIADRLIEYELHRYA